MVIKLVFVILSLFLFIYLTLPGPVSVLQFRPLPNSFKSQEEGDTIQVPNVAAYFSNVYRDYATKLYRANFQELTLFPFPPIMINHAPEDAYDFIKDQTQSTYLEEYVYPLRSSLFVNGLEPLEQNGKPRYIGAIPFEVNNGHYDTKVTLRLYTSPLWARLIDWILINISVCLLYIYGKKLVKRKK
jgi:hypothetical protein